MFLQLLAILLDKFDPKSDGAQRDWVSIYKESVKVWNRAFFLKLISLYLLNYSLTSFLLKPFVESFSRRCDAATIQRDQLRARGRECAALQENVRRRAVG